MLRFIVFLMILGILLVFVPMVYGEYVDVAGKIYHLRFRVYSRDLKRVEFYVPSGTRVEITMDIGMMTINASITSRVCAIACRLGGGCESSCEIYVEIVRPDGTIEYPKNKVDGSFNYSFISTVSGIYVLILDNLYSSFDKDIDLVIVGFPQSTPTTVTTITIERTFTSTRTITLTTTSTIEKLLQRHQL